jgi:hypothetical protein
MGTHTNICARFDVSFSYQKFCGALCSRTVIGLDVARNDWQRRQSSASQSMPIRTPGKGGRTYDGPEQKQSGRVRLISGRLGWIGRHEWIRRLGKRRLAIGQWLAVR